MTVLGLEEEEVLLGEEVVVLVGEEENLHAVLKKQVRPRRLEEQRLCNVACVAVDVDVVERTYHVGSKEDMPLSWFLIVMVFTLAFYIWQGYRKTLYIHNTMKDEKDE